MLREMAEKEGISAGNVLRNALRNRHAHIMQGYPVCASGARCFVPQMHTPPIIPNAGNPQG